MRTVAAREARQARYQLDRLLAGEAKAIISWHGKPVDRLWVNLKNPSLF